MAYPMGEAKRHGKGLRAGGTANILSHGVALPLGFATPGAERLQESDTYLNFSTSNGTFPQSWPHSLKKDIRENLSGNDS